LSLVNNEGQTHSSFFTQACIVFFLHNFFIGHITIHFVNINNNNIILMSFSFIFHNNIQGTEEGLPLASLVTMFYYFFFTLTHITLPASHSLLNEGCPFHIIGLTLSLLVVRHYQNIGFNIHTISIFIIHMVSHFFSIMSYTIISIINNNNNNNTQ